MTKRAQQKKITQLVQRAAEIKDHLATVIPLYRELDDITLEFIEMDVFSVVFGDVQMIIVDNFADKNTMFRVARMKRYELEIEKKRGTLSISKSQPKDIAKAKTKKDSVIFPIRKTKKG